MDNAKCIAEKAVGNLKNVVIVKELTLDQRKEKKERRLLRQERNRRESAQINSVNQDSENRNRLIFSEPEIIPMFVDHPPPPPSPIVTLEQNQYNLQKNPVSDSTLQESRELYNESTVLED